MTRISLLDSINDKNLIQFDNCLRFVILFKLFNLFTFIKILYIINLIWVHYSDNYKISNYKNTMEIQKKITGTKAKLK